MQHRTIENESNKINTLLVYNKEDHRRCDVGVHRDPSLAFGHRIQISNTKIISSLEWEYTMETV